MLNLAVLQFKPALGDVEHNLMIVKEMLKWVRDSSVVLLPEMWQCGFDYPDLRKHAVVTPSVLEDIRDISLKRDLTIVGTYPVFGDEGIFNTAIIVDRGEITGKRHKIKLFPLYDEPAYFKAGSENHVFDTSKGRVGILICFELRFPDLTKQLRNAELILVPAMWGKKRSEHLKSLSRSRAIENQSFLLISNVWGRVGEEEYGGCSAIYSPWGEVLAFSEKGDCIIQTQVDLREVYTVREIIPLF